MVAPGATGASFDVLLQFSLDPAAQERVQKGVSSIDQELKRIEENAQKAGKAINQSFSNIDTKSQSVQTSVIKIGTELAKLGERAKTSSKQTNDALDTNLKKLKQIEEQAKKTRQSSALVSGAAARAAATFSQGLILGGGIVGGALAEAGRFAKDEQDAKRATDATRQWTAATEELAQARRRVDTVLLREALPLLQQAAKVANQAASFMEKHPEIVAAGLKAGVLIAEVSAIGLAVSKGIKLVADVKYIAATATELIAAQLHDRAADKELAAASKGLITNRADDLRKSFGLTGGSSLTGMVAIASQVALAVLAAGAIAGAVKLLVEKIVPKTAATSLPSTSVTGLGNADLRQKQVELANAISRGASPEKIQKLRDEITALGQASYRTAQQVNQVKGAVGSVGGRTPQTDAAARISSDTMEQALKIYEDYRKDDLALVQQHYANRQNIVSDALAQEQAANQKYAQSIARINEQESSALTSATADFAQANARAEQQYQDQRAQIIRDGNDQIQQIERDSKERLRKLEEDYQDQRADVVGRRDALALSKLDRQHAKDVADEKRQTSQEVKQRRQEIAQRLADLARSYEQERAQRLADYQARVAEIHANAAQQLKEVEAEHAAELQQIQQQKAAKLRELDAQFAAERQRRYQYFIAQIRDLDATLLGETKMRQAYQQRMLQDLNNFLEAYRAGLASLSSAVPSPTAKAYGGYASYGMYKLGDSPSGGPGDEEYVIRGLNTKALEQALGGKINDQILLSAVRQFVSGKSVNYVDQRRIDQPVSKWDKRKLEEIALGAMTKALKS